MTAWQLVDGPSGDGDGICVAQLPLGLNAMLGGDQWAIIYMPAKAPHKMVATMIIDDSYETTHEWPITEEVGSICGELPSWLGGSGADPELCAHLERMADKYGVQREAKRIVNLTPHAVNIYNQKGLLRTIEPEGVVPRVKTDERCTHQVAGIPVCKVTVSPKVEDLPAPEPGTIYIVSRMVVDACPDRYDLYSPHDVVRDEHGRIIGCRALSQ